MVVLILYKITDVFTKYMLILYKLIQFLYRWLLQSLFQVLFMKQKIRIIPVEIKKMGLMG